MIKTNAPTSTVRTADTLDPRLIDRMFLGLVAIATVASLILSLLG